MFISDRDRLHVLVMDFVNVWVKERMMEKPVTPIEAEVFYDHAERDLQDSILTKALLL